MDLNGWFLRFNVFTIIFFLAFSFCSILHATLFFSVCWRLQNFHVSCHVKRYAIWSGVLECKAYTLFIAHNARDSSRWLQTMCVIVVAFTRFCLFFRFLLRNSVMTLCLCEKRDATFFCEMKRKINARLVLDLREQMKTNIVFVLTRISDAVHRRCQLIKCSRVNINFIWIYLFRITSHNRLKIKLNSQYAQ